MANADRLRSANLEATANGDGSHGLGGRAPVHLWTGRFGLSGNRFLPWVRGSIARAFTLKERPPALRFLSERAERKPRNQSPRFRWPPRRICSSKAFWPRSAKSRETTRSSGLSSSSLSFFSLYITSGLAQSICAKWYLCIAFDSKFLGKIKKF